MIPDEWIDRREQLPSEDGMLVVVFDPENSQTIFPAKWDAENQCFASNGGWFEESEITHWMPLPKAPKSHEWVEGFRAAVHDEEHKTDTRCPYDKSWPWTFPDYHAGPPTKESLEWYAGYEYRLFEHQRGVIQLKITINTGGSTIHTFM